MLDAVGPCTGATARLGDVAMINPRLQKKLAVTDLVAFVPMSNLSAERAEVILEQVRPYGEVAKSYTPFLDGDVLVAKITPCFENNKIGQARLSQEVAFGSTEFHVIRPKAGKADARYLMHYLRQAHVRAEGERKMTGSAGQRRVPEHFLANLDVPLPPLPEQRRIAAILDQADSLRAKRRAAQAYLDEMAQAIFVEMFGHPLANSRSLPTKPLEKLGRVSTGATPPSSRAGMFGGDVPFVTPGDLGSSDPVRRRVTAEGAETVRTVRAGATLVCCIGATIGKMCKAQYYSAFNQQINAVEWHSQVNDEYGFTALTFYKHLIAAWGASTTLPILKKSSFAKIEIPIPDLASQILFAQRVAVAQAVAVYYRNYASVSEKLFASLQHRAFTGAL